MKLTLSILITTMNDWIDRVKKELLPQLQNTDEVIISHQITNKNLFPEHQKEISKLHKNIKYIFMSESGLSKNRNNAIKNSNSDICYICDDDLNFISWFEKIIKSEYGKDNYDIITFQAENEIWKKHFNIKEWSHNRFSILKIWSWWITFRRKSILENNIFFDELYWLWTMYEVWEENLFLNECNRKKMKMFHSNNSIVIHPEESSWINFRDWLIIWRVKVWKKLYWFLWWLLSVLYFSIIHYKMYNQNYSFKEFLILSFKGLKDDK